MTKLGYSRINNEIKGFSCGKNKIDEYVETSYLDEIAQRAVTYDYKSEVNITDTSLSKYIDIVKNEKQSKAYEIIDNKKINSVIKMTVEAA